MGKIVGVHSFRGGCGKSTITANLAYLLAKRGKKVAVVDCDILTPSMHSFYQLPEDKIKSTLNDYLWNQATLEEIIYEIIPYKLLFIPASLQAVDIVKLVREGYDAERLVSGLEEFIEKYKIDYLLLDTHSGWNEETLLSVSLVDHLLILLTPDLQEDKGTQISLEIAKKLEVPKIHILVNKCSKSIDLLHLKNQMQKMYEMPISGVIDFSEDLASHRGDGIFVEKYPKNEFVESLNSILKEIL